METLRSKAYDHEYSGWHHLELDMPSDFVTINEGLRWRQFADYSGYIQCPDAISAGPVSTPGGSAGLGP